MLGQSVNKILFLNSGLSRLVKLVLLNTLPNELFPSALISLTLVWLEMATGMTWMPALTAASALAFEPFGVSDLRELVTMATFLTLALPPWVVSKILKGAVLLPVKYLNNHKETVMIIEEYSTE